MTGSVTEPPADGQAATHLLDAVTLPCGAEIDPLLEQAVELLSGLYKEQGNGSGATKVIARYQREMGITSAR